MSSLHFLDEAQPIIEQFGNHTKRYQFQYKKSWRNFTDRLQDQNRSYDEYFFNLWPESEYQLMLMEQLGRSTDERIDFIKLFFAFHYLKMNVECVRILDESFSERLETPYNIYRNVLIKVRQVFFTLSRGIMNRLSYYLATPAELPRYTFINVGSLIDHEDLDLGVVYAGEQSLEEFDRFVSRLSQKFFQTVTHLHFYLAEALNIDHYGGNIDIYLDYLNQNNDDFVFVNQVLGATRLIGDMDLFYEFKARIVERYFRSDSEHLRHYLDLASQEIERLCNVPLGKDTIRPKAECYRIFTLLASALRLANQIHRGNIWETFDQFLRVDFENRIFYELLKDSYAFVQILRYLFNLFVTQKDEICFNDPVEGKWLDFIAKLMGMRDRSVLYNDYQYIADRGRESALYLAYQLRTKCLQR
ncbi:hypothetical protein ACFL27_16340 [candidate division CSSED10-310 bacterium]|uniref:PII-uridylyltransferase/Glutamine-synthetase adenylyltransferase domain-containing protein n=1 Tax=candidate division CSSED10-310 bacterium TaxID=2855610 RepID=A0ABV6Z0A7_UNCC1